MGKRIQYQRERAVSGSVVHGGMLLQSVIVVHEDIREREDEENKKPKYEVSKEAKRRQKNMK